MSNGQTAKNNQTKNGGKTYPDHSCISVGLLMESIYKAKTRKVSIGFDCISQTHWMDS